MPTILTHAAVPLAVGLGLGKPVVSRRLLIAGVFASICPDFDVVAFKLGIAYADTLGHRGATHSIGFALILAVIAALTAKPLHARRVVAAAFTFLSAVSHPLLDMLTNGGLGVALYWPWSDERVFASWRGIEVSPIGVSRIFSERGLNVLLSELLWVWLPAAVLCLVLYGLRRRHAVCRLG
ncbi:MAG: metal-dependent hydrolase [Rhodocyclaceae bacterium]